MDPEDRLFFALLWGGLALGGVGSVILYVAIVWQGP